MIANLPELLLYPVEDRGVPNRERIPIYVKEPLNISAYGMMVGQKEISGVARPFIDLLYWFNGGIINQGDWILLYTGSGTNREDDWDLQPGSKIYSVHWGRSTTMFANSLIVPILFKIEAVNIGEGPVDLPQLRLPSA